MEFGDGQHFNKCQPSTDICRLNELHCRCHRVPSRTKTRLLRGRRSRIKSGKAMAEMGESHLLAGALAGLIRPWLFLMRQRQREKLRLGVFWWPEQATVCRRADLNTPNAAEDLKPEVPLRIRRVGKTQNLLVEALDGASIVTGDGREAASQNIGPGARLVVKTASGAEKAVAIAVNQKPRRPSRLRANSSTTSLGLKSTPTQATPSGDFDWGWESAATYKTN